jgi:hypothetical protein
MRSAQLKENIMRSNTLTLLLQLAGLLHFGLLGAGLMMPGAVNLRAHLAGLPTFIRRLFWVYYAFIGFCLVSFGFMTLTLAGPLASGSILARAFCLFFAAFWTLRLMAATFVFDLRPYLINVYRRVGYHAINLVFIYLPVIYLLAAWKGGKL